MLNFGFAGADVVSVLVFKYYEWEGTHKFTPPLILYYGD